MQSYHKRVLADVRKGEKDEVRILPFLEKHFGCSLTKQGDDNFDFANDENSIYVTPTVKAVKNKSAIKTFL